MDRAEQLEERIRWRIAQHFPSLPVGRTFFFEQLPDELRAGIAATMETHDAGRPALAAVDSPNCWTLVGTSAVVSQYADQVRVCKLTEIAELHTRDRIPEGLSPEEYARRKSSWEYLRITDRAGSHHDIWLPAGSEAFAFWNTLLMLGRMCAGMPVF